MRVDPPAISGRYIGSGIWHDAQGQSLRYVVAQTNRFTAEGFDVEFTHDFADNTQVRAHFEMTWMTPFLFRVNIGASQVGHGFCLANACKYHIKTGEAFVEVSYHPTADRLEVYGSSSRNAEGNYIAWHEELRRTN